MESEGCMKNKKNRTDITVVGITVDDLLVMENWSEYERMITTCVSVLIRNAGITCSAYKYPKISVLSRIVNSIFGTY